ncbi:MAG TPA: metal ABC transporter substrate-binding protein [Candidatus Hydrogenedentes bacterium]|nr:metal ABC transporter substrate-binding protein [Candidatus Hydrogenedentota bacterium]
MMRWMAFFLLAPLAGAAADKPSYVATIHPAAAIVREVTGTRAEVTRLIAPGASPHTYSPRPSDMVAVESAAALVMVSPELDGWAAKFPAKKTFVLMDALPAGLRLAPPVLDHDHEQGHDDAAEECGARSFDPHFWMDPVCVKALLPALVEWLGGVDPEGKPEYVANAARFASDLDRLDREAAAIVAPIKGASVVSFHPSMGYFLKRYGLVHAGSIEPSPGKEPTPRYIESVVKTVRKTGAKAVFTEPTLPKRPAQVVAEAAGVALGEIDVEGGSGGRQTYSDLILHNARQLSDLLK